MNFKYKARSSEGKIVEGVLSAPTQEGAVSAIRQRGLFPIKVERSAASLKKSEESLLDQLRKMGSVPLREKVIFFRQLSAMINAGVTRVVYSGGYPDRLSCEMLTEAGVQLDQAP